jgi:hypothetical protein
MINIEYTMTPEETAKATFDFLANRPFISLLFFFMKTSCFIICIGFVIAVYNKSVRIQDVVSALFALIWISAFKEFNRWMINKRLKNKAFGNAKNEFKIDHKSIFCRFQASNPQNIEWKKLKYILQNKDGYIIPLTGMSNAGKFMWLPFRCFENKSIEQDFLELVKNFKLKIKKIKS